MRDSNIELLRLLTMVLVMLVHASFLSIGIPTMLEAHAAPLTTLGRYFIESISIICVDVFVIISGWYGIKWHPIKMSSLAFQAYFYSILAFLFVTLVLGQSLWNVESLRHLLLLDGDDYWFIKSYLIFFILAPALNAFVNTESEQTQRYCLLAFFGMQTIFGWLSIDGAGEFEGGYSALSFVGLYLLTRYVRVHQQRVLAKFTIQRSLSVFLFITALQAFLAFLLTWKGVIVVGRLFTYTNPLVIIQAFSLVVLFAKIRPFHNKVINTLASSCLAVYLLHGNTFILRPYYGKMIRNAYLQENGLNCLFYIFGIIIIFFLGALLIDQVRKFLWNAIVKN